MSEPPVRFFNRLERIFRQYDQDSTDTLSYWDFEKALNNFGYFPKQTDLHALLKYYDPSGSRVIPYMEYLQDARVPMNERRHSVVEKAWMMLNPQSLSCLEPENLTQKLNPTKLRELTKRKLDSEVFSDFLSFFMNKPVITKTDFVNYHTDLSNSIIGDDYFVEIVQSTWSVKEEHGDLITKESIKKMIDNFRLKLLNMSKGAEIDEYVLRKLFAHFDVDKKGQLGLAELKGLFEKLEIKISDKFLRAIFGYINKNREGMMPTVMPFENFLNYIFYDYLH